MNKPVYIIGAGFSAELGYPTLSGLLSGLYERINPESKQLLTAVIKFHYPHFVVSLPPERWPNIEQLLTRIAINLEFFDVVRGSEGGLKRADLEGLQNELLYSINIWFDEINKKIDIQSEEWLSRFVSSINGKKNATIISFNWDLVLDNLLTNSPSKEIYLSKLLKPHGSLNWFLLDKISVVSDDKKEWLYRIPTVTHPPKRTWEYRGVQIFLPSRKIQSKTGKKYIPWIVPPTFLKKFDHKFLQQTWGTCTKKLSEATAIYFLGYSLPEADLHAQYVLHCGYHNHTDGYLGNRGRTKPKSSLPKSYIINPSLSHAQHITDTVGQNCHWFRGSVKEWLSKLGKIDNNEYFELKPML